MRFALRLAYKGTAYSGWQKQNNASTVQEEVERALSLRLGTGIGVTGCCRTDAGVHAADYVLHFDYEKSLDDSFLYNINNILPKDIAVKKIYDVEDDFHARFDAVSRSYVYKIHSKKDPFKEGLSFYFPAIEKADLELMQKATEIIAGYDEFFPFCKTHTDVKTMKCDIRKSFWIFDKNKDEYSFHITADRFLRGMVRLIVGAVLNTGLGKMDIEELKDAMQKQRRLKLNWSVPAHGLYLNKIDYLTLD